MLPGARRQHVDRDAREHDSSWSSSRRELRLGRRRHSGAADPEHAPAVVSGLQARDEIARRSGRQSCRQSAGLAPRQRRDIQQRPVLPPGDRALVAEPSRPLAPITHARVVMTGGVAAGVRVVPSSGSLVIRYGGLPIAMFTLTPMYSAMMPSENRMAPAPSSTMTIVDAQPSGTAPPVSARDRGCRPPPRPRRLRTGCRAALTSRRPRVPLESTIRQKCAKSLRVE